MTDAAKDGPLTRRWTEQRWLLDNTIRAVGMDWDQPRSTYLAAPCGPEVCDGGCSSQAGWPYSSSGGCYCYSGLRANRGRRRRRPTRAWRVYTPGPLPACAAHCGKRTAR